MNTNRCPNDSPLLPTDLSPVLLSFSVSLLYCCSAFLASSRVCLDADVVLNVITRSTSGNSGCGDSGIYRGLMTRQLKQVIGHFRYNITNTKYVPYSVVMGQIRVSPFKHLERYQNPSSDDISKFWKIL